MKRFPAILLSAALTCAPAFAFGAQTHPPANPQHKTAKQDMRDAGHKTKDAARDTARGTEKGTKKAYHATKRGAKKAYNKTKNTTEGAVRGGKQGAKQPQ